MYPKSAEFETGSPRKKVGKHSCFFSLFEDSRKEEESPGEQRIDEPSRPGFRRGLFVCAFAAAAALLRHG
jgi:hypothetical protein